MKKSLAVLVVEDSEDLAELAQLILTSKGHRVFKSRSGEAALEQLGREPIDVLLLDLTLPDIDPQEFMQRLKADGKGQNVSVVLVSGRADIDEWAQRFGGIPCLRKPYDFNSLIETVESSGKA